MSAAPAAIPYKIVHKCTPDYNEKQSKGALTFTEEINLAIKSAARTINKTKLSDKIPSKHVLNRAGLKNLNEMAASASAIMVWKSKLSRDPLGKRFFPEKNNLSSVNTRSSKSDVIRVPVPGYPSLPVNLMATAWNENPELQNASTLGSAKTTAKKWAKLLT